MKVMFKDGTHRTVRDKEEFVITQDGITIIVDSEYHGVQYTWDEISSIDSDGYGS